MADRAALYIRVSGKNQVEGHSLDAQLADLRGYCDRHRYRVARIFRDVGSGMSLDERPGMQLAMGLAERASFDVLVFWDRARFGRGPIAGLVEEHLVSCGVRVEDMATGPQEPSDELELATGTKDLFNRWEARQITKRNTRGRRAAAAKGLWPTQAPYGYRKEVPGKASRLVLDEHEARRMKEAYEKYLAGWSRPRIGALLGIDMTAAINRLRSPVYKGMHMYAGIPVPCPGVVDADTWQRVQDLIVARRNQPIHRKPAYSRKESWLGPPQDLVSGGFGEHPTTVAEVDQPGPDGERPEASDGGGDLQVARAGP